MSEPRNVRHVMLLTASEDAAITQFRFSNQIGSMAETLRRLCLAGLDQLGDGSQAHADVEPVNFEPPTIPQPEECGRPVLGELILPYLRSEGRRSYAVDEVARAVFGDTAHLPGRDAAVRNVFKAIGWQSVTVRDGKTAIITYRAPD